METKNVLRQLRESHNLTQDQMAERLMVFETGGEPLGKWRDTAKYRYTAYSV